MGKSIQNENNMLFFPTPLKYIEHFIILNMPSSSLKHSLAVRCYTFKTVFNSSAKQANTPAAFVKVKSCLEASYYINAYTRVDFSSQTAAEQCVKLRITRKQHTVLCSSVKLLSFSFLLDVPSTCLERSKN